jgi:hypothetical protein
MGLMWITIALLTAPPLRSWCTGEPPALHIRSGEIEIIILADRSQFVAQADRPKPPDTQTPNRDLLDCTEQKQCQFVARLRTPIVGALRMASNWLLALAGPRPGLFSGPLSTPWQTTPLYQGSVDCVCRLNPETAAAVIAQPALAQVWRWHDETGAGQAVALSTILTQTLGANPLTDSGTAAALLTRAADESWPERPEMLRLAMAYTDAKVRQAAVHLAGEMTDAAGAAALWLLAHDVDRGVRRTALNEVARRCQHANLTTCAQSVWPFADDPDDDVAFTARDLLLSAAPELALRSAPQRYKLDLLSNLAEQLERTQNARVLNTILLLEKDRDPSVAEAARAMLSTIER